MYTLHENAWSWGDIMAVLANASMVLWALPGQNYPPSEDHFSGGMTLTSDTSYHLLNSHHI